MNDAAESDRLFLAISACIIVIIIIYCCCWDYCSYC